MNAPKISQTVAFENPDSAQLMAALLRLNPGLASSAGLYSTHGARSVVRVTPAIPMAPPGSGSSIKPTITAMNSAKKYHACFGKPAGAGRRAIITATTTGVTNFQLV